VHFDILNGNDTYSLNRCVFFCKPTVLRGVNLYNWKTNSDLFL